MKRRSVYRTSVSAFVLVFLFGVSQAAISQTTRTWVSVNGYDGNDCSRATPCRTLSGALAKTSAGGEIDILDSGDFGPVTLNKTISLVTPGVLGGIQTTTGTAITVNAGANDKIVLRGLTIDGAGTGGTGISFVAGGTLSIEGCTVNNFGTYGIEFAPAGASELHITNTAVRNNGAGGVLIKPTGSGSATAVVTRFSIENNNFGLRADGTASTAGINVSVKDGSVSGNTNSGVISVSTSALTQVIVDGTTISNNGTGVRADQLAAILRFGNSTISGNGVGMSTANGGQLLSYGSNQVHGNTDDGVSPPVISTK